MSDIHYRQVECQSLPSDAPDSTGDGLLTGLPAIADHLDIAPPLALLGLQAGVLRGVKIENIWCALAADLDAARPKRSIDTQGRRQLPGGPAGYRRSASFA